MKIQGSFFEIFLSLKSENVSIIEMKIVKGIDTVFRADITMFAEVQPLLEDFCKKHNIGIPSVRLNSMLQQLEGEFEEISQRIKQKQNLQAARQQETAKILSSVKTKAVYKFLLMGLSEAGKTSIYQVLFGKQLPHETKLLNPTRGIERHDVSNPVAQTNIPPATKVQSEEGSPFIIWELGGQRQFLERYYEEPERYFGQSSCLIFVIDIFNVERYEEARVHLHKTIGFVMKYCIRPTHLASTDSILFCFLHKMDQFQDKTEKFKSLCEYFSIDPTTNQKRTDIQFYPTSIYDASIYSAWTKVIRLIIPKSAKLNMLAQELKDELNLYAVLVIERRTGLPICSSKMIMDDTVITGDTDRIVLNIDRILNDFSLTKLKEVKITAENGILEIRIFNQFYILVLLYPHTVNFCSPDTENKIVQFIENMKKFI